MENTVNVESAAVDGTGRPLWCGLLQNRQTLLRVLQQPRQRLAIQQIKVAPSESLVGCRNGYGTRQTGPV
jgi:hypothetical protein